MKRIVLAALGLALMSTASLAEGLPGMRGHDHTGVTVPDMAQAVTFFTDIVGCKKVMSFGPFRDDKGTFMKDVLDVNPRAVITQITMIRCGSGSNIELFSYNSPDQQHVQPKNSDIGGYHIAFYVDDIKTADQYLRSKGVNTMFGPIPVSEGRQQGRRSSISRPPGACSSKPSPIRTAWRTRRPRTRSCGARKIRESDCRIA